MKSPRTFAKTRGFLCAFGLCILPAALAPLHAQESYTQAFDAPVGGIPAGWKRAGGFLSAQGVSEIVTNGGHAWLRQQRTEGPRGNSFVYFNGDFGTVQGGLLSDFTATVILKVSGGLDGDGRGMMIRADSTGAVPSGYFVYIADNSLQISHDPANATTGRGTVLAKSAETFGKLASGSEYRFTVSAKGETISGSLHAWDEGTSSFSILLAEVSTEDAAHGSGYFGFRTAFSNESRSVFWRDLTITTTPEPSTAAPPIPAAN